MNKYLILLENQLIMMRGNNMLRRKSNKPSLKELKEKEAQHMRDYAEKEVNMSSARVQENTGTRINGSFMKKNGKLYVMNMEPRNRFESRMKWKEL